VSEYYLSRHQSPSFQKVPSDSTVIIVSDDPGFASNITEMTLFILMVSFTQGREGGRERGQGGRAEREGIIAARLPVCSLTVRTNRLTD
jgi:hypothetical protein